MQAKAELRLPLGMQEAFLSGEFPLIEVYQIARTYFGEITTVIIENQLYGKFADNCALHYDNIVNLF